ncbi:MAG: DUF2207 domain-containing protein [Clostridia bacterium]|nr:DUF2207 domain-containing protein [Clostridia bacterium]
MKAFNVKYCLIAILAAISAAILCLSLFSTDAAYASSHSDGEDDSYSYTIEDFEAVYDIDESGYMRITEILTVEYTGAKSYAVSMTLVTDGGDRVRNFSALEYEQSTGEYADAEFTIDSESGDVEVAIGDEDSKTGETHIYKIYYEYFSADNAESGLTIYPFRGIEAEIKNAEITLNLPYEADTVFTLDGTQISSVSGKTAAVYITDASSGATLCASVAFRGAVIDGYSDYSGYYALIILAALAAAFIVVKFVFFNKNKLKAELRRDPPFGYDPLIVGKLVDNSVSDSDVASLIFHWAAKGFVKIDLKDANKPVIIKIKNLPAIAPDYQQMLFYKLFKHTNVVYLDELDDDFCKTTEAVKKAVDKKASGSYRSVSMGLSVLFAVLAAFVIGVAPLVYAMTKISVRYVYITGLIFALPPLIVYGITESLMYNRFKLKPKVIAGYVAGIVAICAVCTILYVYIVPSNIIEVVPKILISVFGYALSVLSVFMITRTEKYNEQLGEILGFRKYIITAEHMELRESAMKNHMIFYEIYPYADVLNLEKEWTDKFSSMNVQCPDCGIRPVQSGGAPLGITSAMRTARSKISLAISTSPDATKHKK